MKIFFSFLVALTFFTGCRNNQKSTQNEASHPLNPQEALASFEVEPGFKIELLTSEPMISDPVDMEIDEYGRVYVVEMHGYPLDKSGSGKIKMLTDTDGDGKLDKSTVFADHLVLPNGVMRWKKGILVTDAPNVLYFEDTDGDGKADIRDTVLTGFSLSNPHINVNNPLYGLDNWIHLAHRGAIDTRHYENIFGDKGTEVYFPDQPDSPRLPKNADSRSVRFRPDTHQLENTSIQAQFGHTFDLFGHHLFGDNQDHQFAEVLAAQYIKRNPQLMVGTAEDPISDHGNDPEIFQITTHPERQMFSGVGTMTSGSGIVDYLGGLFPAPFNDNVTFICESVSNLVHADHQRDSGASFVASRVGRPHHEFLASKDAWCRPVNLYIGPDGALYVVDYYRQIIEHPEWMSDEAVKAGGLYNGNTMGRIYRVTPTNAPGATWVKGLKLGDASSKELVQYLSDKNIWWRTNAQRLLVDRQDKSVVPDLIEMTKNKVLEGRLHALWTLEGLNSLTEDVIAQALKDTVAGIRENAVRLAEIHLKTSPGLVKDLFALQNDPNAKVRYQLLCTLGYITTPEAEKVRNNLLFHDINDKWVQVAALSAADLHAGSLLSLVLKRYQPTEVYGSLALRLTAMVGSSGDKASIHNLIGEAIAPGSRPWQESVLDGLAQGLKNRKDKLSLESEQPVLVKTFFDNPSDKVRKGAVDLLKVIGITNESLAKTSIQKAAGIATDKSLTNEKRIAAINFLSLRNPAPYAGLLEKLITPQEHLTVQLAALQNLSLIPDLTVSEYLLQVWTELTPGIRDAAIATFMINTQRKRLLMSGIASNKIEKTSINFGRMETLMQDPDDSVRIKALELLGNKDQENINKAYEESLSMTGDPEKGKLVFLQNCARCHQIRGKIGVKFGPDLGTVQNWLPKDIMANILAPSLAIAVGFDQWGVKMKDGEMLQGIISSETSASITLRTSPGEEKVINRQDIETLTMMKNSPMPVLTQQIDHRQMADLLSFLRHAGDMVK